MKIPLPKLSAHGGGGKSLYSELSSGESLKAEGFLNDAWKIRNAYLKIPIYMT